MAIFEGKWQLIESDDMDEFLDATGVKPEIKQKAKDMVNGMIKEMIKDGDNWTMKTYLSDNTIENHYTVDQWANKFALDGRPMRGVLRFEGDVMVEEGIGDGFKVRHERRVEGDKLLQNIWGNGVEIKRKYQKIA